MLDASGQPFTGTLEEFLDSLPTQPCPETPSNRYYCTVCERLNKSIASRCQYSKLEHSAQESEGDQGDTIKFLPMQETGEEPTGKLGEKGEDKVKFKVVTTKTADEDYPLFELVQSKDKQITPIEMELLEDVAIEFEPAKENEEPVEVEALEVVPLDDYDEEEEGMEVEVVEVSEAETLDDESVVEPITGTSEEEYPTFMPISKGAPEFIPIESHRKPVKKAPVKKTKMPVKIKGKKKPMQKEKKPSKKVPKLKQKPKPERLSWSPESRVQPVQPTPGRTMSVGSKPMPQSPRKQTVTPSTIQASTQPTTQPSVASTPTPTSFTMKKVTRKIPMKRKVPMKKM